MTQAQNEVPWSLRFFWDIVECLQAFSVAKDWKAFLLTIQCAWVFLWAWITGVALDSVTGYVLPGWDGTSERGGAWEVTMTLPKPGRKVKLR